MEAIEFLKAKRNEIIKIAAEHGAYNIRVFGSIARGEAGPDSDVDFLVDLKPVHPSWFPAGLEIDLTNLLGQRIEVVTENSIYWLLRRKILKEAIPL